MLRMEAPTLMIKKIGAKRFNEKTHWRREVTVSCTLWTDEIFNVVSTTTLWPPAYVVCGKVMFSVVSVSLSTGRVPCGKSPVQTCSLGGPPCPDLSPTLRICWHADGWPSTERLSCLLLPQSSTCIFQSICYGSVFILRAMFRSGNKGKRWRELFTRTYRHVTINRTNNRIAAASVVSVARKV